VVLFELTLASSMSGRRPVTHAKAPERRLSRFDRQADGMMRSSAPG